MNDVDFFSAIYALIKIFEKRTFLSHVDEDGLGKPAERSFQPSFHFGVAGGEHICGWISYDQIPRLVRALLIIAAYLLHDQASSMIACERVRGDSELTAAGGNYTSVIEDDDEPSQSSEPNV